MLLLWVGSTPLGAPSAKAESGPRVCPALGDLHQQDPSALLDRGWLAGRRPSLQAPVWALFPWVSSQPSAPLRLWPPPAQVTPDVWSQTPCEGGTQRWAQAASAPLLLRLQVSPRALRGPGGSRSCTLGPQAPFGGAPRARQAGQQRAFPRTHREWKCCRMGARPHHWEPLGTLPSQTQRPAGLLS